jgi:O-antigen ligase
MDTPFLEIMARLNLQSFAIITIFTIFLLFFALPKRIYGLMFFLVLSAAFVGSSVPIISAASSLMRWIIILLLLVSSLLFSRMRVSFGILLFWGYVFLGFVSLFGSNSLMWQFQRGSLLMMVAVAIPLAYGKKPYRVYQLSLIAIAVVASLFSIYSFIPLQSQINVAERFSGFSKAAPNFAMTLGGLLPFAFWGLWRAEARWIRLLCGAGFFLGLVTLLSSGQRAGTLAGILGIIPMLLMVNTKKEAIWKILAIAIFIGISILYLTQSPASERINFLISRYSLDEGLSNREWIWRVALSEINENPFMGHGIGAAESIISSSFHNAYLEVWYNTGLLGLLFFVAAQIYFFYRIFLLRRRHLSDEMKAIVALTLGYMLGFVVLCMFESVGATASTLGLILYIFLGVMISNDDLFKSNSPEYASQKTIPAIRQSDFNPYQPV